MTENISNNLELMRGMLYSKEEIDRNQLILRNETSYFMIYLRQEMLYFFDKVPVMEAGKEKYTLTSIMSQG
jgi:hypothetical protein